MTSKEIGARSGVARANIRYYEAEGLLTPAENGCRDYGHSEPQFPCDRLYGSGDPQ